MVRILVSVPLVCGIVSSAAAKEITVTMHGMEYRPATVQAAVGDTIRFVNDDSMQHAVFVPSTGHALDLGAQEPGEERQFLLRAPGQFEVECIFHPEMHLGVEVK